jgi:Fur family transcriptional regulator, ferric uptake regulator
VNLSQSSYGYKLPDRMLIGPTITPKANNSPEFYDAVAPNDLGLARARHLLRRARLRATTPRLAVLRMLSRERRPLSHAEVAHTLEATGFDRVTVFRNPLALAEAAILSRVDVGDHTWRFELRADDSLSGVHHSHFVCERCRSVTWLDNLSPTSLPRTRTFGAIVASVSEVVLRGCCRYC